MVFSAEVEEAPLPAPEEKDQRQHVFRDLEDPVRQKGRRKTSNTGNSGLGHELRARCWLRSMLVLIYTSELDTEDRDKLAIA